MRLTDGQAYALKAWIAAYEHLETQAVNRGFEVIPYSLLAELITEMKTTLDDYE